MEQILLYAIVSITLVFSGLTISVVINKAWREAREKYAAHRRAKLEPHLLAYAHGDQPSLEIVLGEPVARRDRSIVETTFLDHLQRVRGNVAERMGAALHELGFVDEALARLNSGHWWRRAEAAERLGLAGAERATDPLISLLDDESPEVRMRAAKALGALGGPRASRQLVQALDRPDRWSTIRIADILTEMGREVVADLLTAFPDLQKRGKLAVLDVLGRIRPSQASAWLLKKLHDDDPDVRARACHALGCIRDPGSAAGLLEVLDDPEWPVRAMGVKALGKVRQTVSISALQRKLRDEEWWVRSNAGQALLALGARGLEALEQMLGDEDRYARHQAILMLERAGLLDRRVDQLVAEDERLRESAEAFVRRFIEAGELERLQALAEEHADLRVRLKLGVLLRRGSGEEGSG